MILKGGQRGGAGHGDPKTRDRDKVEADLRNGLISEETARSVYRWSPA